MRVKWFFLTCILLVAIPLSVSAQPSGELPQPSQGGKAGGPGMNGAAYFPSNPELQTLNTGQPVTRTRPTPPPDRGRGVIAPDLSGRGGMQGGGFTVPEGLSARFEGRGSAGNMDISQFFAFDSSKFAALGLTPPFDTEQAQATYNQYWTDYAATIEATAETYFTTISSSAELAIDTYQQALLLSTIPVDEFVAGATDVALYCAAYPWDCYSYAYDAATDTYTDVSTASDLPQGGVMIEPPAAESISVSPPTSSAEAYENLVMFGNDQLGLNLRPIYAGAPTAELTAVMGYLPAEMQTYLSVASAMSEAQYWGLWQGGAGAVMIGACSAETSCAIDSETISLALTSASAGGYTLLIDTSMPTSAESALHLLTTVYPKLNGLTFAQVTNVETGLAFTATASSIGYDAETGNPISVAKVVYVGAVEINGQTLTYALVGSGEAYASLFGK